MSTRDLNTIAMIGRLTKDSEMRYTHSGTAVMSLTLAVNSMRKRGSNWEEVVSFFPVSLFGKTAENLQQYLTKGVQVAVRGELEQQRWESGGDKFSKVIIQAREIQLLSRPNTHPTRTPVPKTPSYTSERHQEQEPQRSEHFQGPEFFADDVPF